VTDQELQVNRPLKKKKQELSMNKNKTILSMIMFTRNGRNKL
jgi:hypothetical protein